MPPRRAELSSAPVIDESVWRDRVLSYLGDHVEDIVSDLIDLMRIPSVSGSAAEYEIQHLLAGRLARDDLEVDSWQLPLDQLLSNDDFPGVEVDRTEAWGTVARIPGSGDGPSLLLDAHVDVVPPGNRQVWGEAGPFTGDIRGGNVHGRGACDMKAGLVASLWTVRAIADLGVPLRGDLIIGTVMGEEDGGLGTYAMLHRGWRADACVIPEPTSLDISPGNCGSLTFRLTVRGLATHAARRREGVSAIEKFLPVFLALRRLEATRNQVKHPVVQRWDLPNPIEIGSIQAGDWASTVPDLLTATGRLGVAIGEPVDDARRALHDAVAESCAADPWLRLHPVHVEWWGGQFAPALTDLDTPIVHTVQRAHAAVSQRPQAVWGSPYGSDLRLLRNIGGIPTLHYGPGDARLAHGPHESVPVDELITATRTLALVALTHCVTG